MFKTKIKSLNKIVAAVFIWIFLWMLSSSALMCLQVWSNFAVIMGFFGGISMAGFFYFSTHGQEYQFSAKAVNVFRFAGALVFVIMMIVTFKYLLSQTSGRIALGAMILFLNIFSVGILEFSIMCNTK